MRIIMELIFYQYVSSKGVIFHVPTGMFLRRFLQDRIAVGVVIVILITVFRIRFYEQFTRAMNARTVGF